jgi:hypothetical protein
MHEIESFGFEKKHLLPGSNEIQNAEQHFYGLATFNNISVITISYRSVLLVEETGVPGENHRPVASY